VLGDLRPGELAGARLDQRLVRAPAVARPFERDEVRDPRDLIADLAQAMVD
jgi:hypothetical protein